MVEWNVEGGMVEWEGKMVWSSNGCKLRPMYLLETRST